MTQKTLRFPDGTIIVAYGNVTEYLHRNHTNRVEEWLNYKERFDAQMRLLDAHLASGREKKMRIIQ